jgi:hypothetical protein
MVDVPEIAAAGLKGHIAYENPFRREHVQVACAGKVSGICLVFLPPGKNPALGRIIVLLTHSFSPKMCFKVFPTV